MATLVEGKEPTLYGSVLKRCSIRERRLLLTSLEPIYRPQTYFEDHIFQPFSPVFAVSFDKDKFQVICGRAIRCFQIGADKNEVAYNIFCAFPTPRITQVIWWGCFHYQEDAVFALLHHLDSPELDVIKKFTMWYGPNEDMEKTITNFTLATHFQPRDLPLVNLASSDIHGGFVLGSSFHRLVKDDAQPENGVSNEVHPQQSPSNADSDSEHLKEPYPAYDPLFRRDFVPTVNSCTNKIYLRRSMDITVEMIAMLAFSRIPEGHSITYENIYDIIRRDLQILYFESTPYQRRFVRFSDYKLAIDILIPGSYNLFWCSLCNLSSGFKYEMALRRHYEEKHCMCLPKYICTNKYCDKTTSLPSEFVTHILSCDPTVAISLVRTIPSFIMDGFADFLLSKESGNHMKYILRPGLPSRKNLHNPGPSKRKGTKSPSHKECQMNLTTKRPKDESVPLVPIQLQVQKTYIVSTNWPTHSGVAHKDAEEADLSSVGSNTSNK